MKANRELWNDWIKLTIQFSEFKFILQNDKDDFTDDNLTEWLICYHNHMKDQINLFQKTIDYIFEQMNKTPTEKSLLQQIWRELKPQNNDDHKYEYLRTCRKWFSNHE